MTPSLSSALGTPALKRENEGDGDKDDTKRTMSPALLGPSVKRLRISQTPDEKLKRMLDPSHNERRGKKKGQGAGETRKAAADYSNNPKSQRNRERIQAKTDEDLDLERVKARDRHAKWYARQKILDSDIYKAKDLKNQAQYMDDKLETLSHVRDTKGISAFELEYDFWLKAKQREERECEKAQEKYREILEAHKPALGSFNDFDIMAYALLTTQVRSFDTNTLLQQNPARDCVQKIWTPFIKDLERQVAKQGANVLAGVEWIDNADIEAESEKVFKAFAKDLWDPEGINRPEVKYRPFSFIEVLEGEYDREDDQDLTITRRGNEDDPQADEVDEEEFYDDDYDNSSGGDLNIVLGGTVEEELESSVSSEVDYDSQGESTGEAYESTDDEDNDEVDHSDEHEVDQNDIQTESE